MRLSKFDRWLTNEDRAHAVIDELIDERREQFERQQQNKPVVPLVAADYEDSVDDDVFERFEIDTLRCSICEQSIGPMLLSREDTYGAEIEYATSRWFRLFFDNGVDVLAACEDCVES